MPTQRPISANSVARLLNRVQIHLAVAKPGLDESDRLLVAIDSSKLTRRVFEIHVIGVDAVGLALRKALIILS